MTDVITDTDKFHCIERELVYRRRVYARLVDSAKMMPGKAARELSLMEAILEDYRARAESERLL